MPMTTIWQEGAAMDNVCLCEVPHVRAKFKRTWECTICGKPEQPASPPAEAAGVDAELQELRAKVATLSSGDCIACNGSGAIQDGAECSTCYGTGAHGSLARAHLLRAMAEAEALPAGVEAVLREIMNRHASSVLFHDKSLAERAWAALSSAPAQAGSAGETGNG